MKEYAFINTPIGMLYMESAEGALRRLSLWKEPAQSKISALVKDKSEALSTGSSPFLERVKRELIEYFRGERREFTIPLSPEGTSFQRSVWTALQKIPYGEIRSYKDIAEAVGHVNASRAVGRANGENPIIIIVPCHRVVQSDGSLGGYTGGLSIKKYLLHLEGVNRYD